MSSVFYSQSLIALREGHEADAPEAIAVAIGFYPQRCAQTAVLNRSATLSRRTLEVELLQVIRRAAFADPANAGCSSSRLDGISLDRRCRAYGRTADTAHQLAFAGI
jgi:hypothetical protein